MTDIHANIQEQGDTLVATAKTRMNLAIHHLFAACRLAARVGEIERANAKEPFGEFWEEIFQNSLGVATLTVACIECYANELFFEASALGRVLNPTAAATVADLVDNQSILQWFGEQDKHEKLSKVLQYKFKTSIFLSSEPVFPRAWASHDFCVWALRTAVAFLAHFYERAGLQFPLAQFESRLSQLSANAL